MLYRARLEGGRLTTMIIRTKVGLYTIDLNDSFVRADVRCALDPPVEDHCMVTVMIHHPGDSHPHGDCHVLYTTFSSQTTVYSVLTFLIESIVPVISVSTTFSLLQWHCPSTIPDRSQSQACQRKILLHVTGSRNYEMTTTKPEICVTQHINEIETKFQMLPTTDILEVGLLKGVIPNTNYTRKRECYIGPRW